MKPFLRLLFLCVAIGWLPTVRAADANKPAPGKFGHGLLWQIEAPGRPPSFLYGTMHVDDERVLGLAAPVRKAFAAAGGFAIEMIEDESASSRYRRAMLAPVPVLEGLLGSADYARTAGLLAQRGLPAEAVAHFKPWAALLILLQPPGPSGIILDRLLLDDARKAGKQITALESIEEQIDVFDGMPVTTQLALLRDVLGRQDEIADAQRRVTNAYLESDLAAMWRINAESMGDDPALAEHNDLFLERILYERNRRFAERLQALLRQGGVFAAFGALHLHGPQGVPALLQGMGFRVRMLH